VAIRVTQRSGRRRSEAGKGRKKRRGKGRRPEKKRRERERKRERKRNAVKAESRCSWVEDVERCVFVAMGFAAC
jgi:ribosome assembly protein YihI (activator of Der GTPase)